MGELDDARDRIYRELRAAIDRFDADWPKAYDGTKTNAEIKEYMDRICGEHEAAMAKANADTEAVMRVMELIGA